MPGGEYVTSAGDSRGLLADTGRMLECLLLIPVVIAVLFWSGYHYYKDRHLPEPPGNLLLCLALGVAASWLSRGMYLSLDLVGLRFDALALANGRPAALFAYSVLAIGPIEEIAKLLPFLLFVRRFREFDEPIDGITYASFLALGYAAAENIYYLEFLSPVEALLRGFASPIVHILFASVWGHWIGLAHIAGRSILRPALVGTAAASGLHGVYDFVVLLNPRGALPIAAFLILGIWIWRMRLMRLMHLDAIGANASGH